MGEYSSLLIASQTELDSAKRLSDIVNGYATFLSLEEKMNSWIAVRLSDGGTDGVLYGSRRDAVRHQVHESQCAYLSLAGSLGGMPVQEAHVVLKFHRDAYDSGYTFVDPEHPTGGLDIQMPIAVEDVRSHIRTLQRRKRKAH